MLRWVVCRACPLLLLPPAPAQRLSPLASLTRLVATPKVSEETITREEFITLLEHAYAPKDAAKGMVDVEADSAVIKTQLTPAKDFRLRFARRTKPHRRRRSLATGGPHRPLPPASPEKPLAGLKIALDPGHIGARVDERWKNAGSRSGNRGR